jgi:hypothetical protein
MSRRFAPSQRNKIDPSGIPGKILLGGWAATFLLPILIGLSRLFIGVSATEWADAMYSGGL